MRVVWLDGGLVAPRDAALSIDDPAVRWGEGLLETMRADDGRIALLERHLDRLARSAQVLGLAPMPTVAQMRAAVADAVDAAGGGVLRVRLCASPRPTLLVEVTPEPERPIRIPRASALSLRGAWIPGNRIAEHKTLSYAGHRWSQRRATTAGADHALLLDERGRLGEAAVASVFCAVGGELTTAPATGLLAGVARSVVLEALAVREEALGEKAWRAAEEIVLTNAVRGVVSVIAVDGRPVERAPPGGGPRPSPAPCARQGRPDPARGRERDAHASPQPHRDAQLARRLPGRWVVVVETRRPSRRIAFRPSDSFSRSSVLAMSRPESSAMRSSR